MTPTDGDPRGGAARPATVDAPVEADRSGGIASRWLPDSMAVLRSALRFGLVVGRLELGLVLASKRLREPNLPPITA